MNGPIPLHRYRKFKKTKTDKRGDRISVLAKRLQLPRAALEARPDLSSFGSDRSLQQTNMRPFQDPDPFHEFTYPTVIAGKRAIADYLAQPLARLSSEQLAFIDNLLAETLQKKVIIQRVRDYFYPRSQEGSHAH